MWLSSLKNHWEKLSPTEGLGGLLWIFTLPLSPVFWKGLVSLWFWAWLLFHLVLRESLPLYHFLSAWLTDGCMISCLYRMFKVSQTSHHFLNASALHFGLTFLSMWVGQGTVWGRSLSSAQLGVRCSPSKGWYQHLSWCPAKFVLVFSLNRFQLCLFIFSSDLDCD